MPPKTRTGPTNQYLVPLPQDYTEDNMITNGSANRTKRCRESQATSAFLWFGFASYAASCFFSALNARSTGVNLRGIRKGGPSMSQV